MRALLVPLLALPLFAQAQRPARVDLPPAPGVTIEVRLLEVDAVVTDRNGNPVTGLGPDDFEIFENGRRQAITNFAEHRETGEVTVAATPAPTPATTATPALAKPAPRTLILLLDMPPVRGSARTKLYNELRALVGRIMREGDRAQILYWTNGGGVRSLTPLTRNRAELEKALNDAEQALTAFEGGSLSIEEQTAWLRDLAESGALVDIQRESESLIRARAEEDLSHMRRKTAAVQRLIASLSAPGDDKAVFIYVSDQFPLIAGKRHFAGARPGGYAPSAEEGRFNTQSMLNAIVRSANAAGVAFYGVRPELSKADRIPTRAEQMARATEIDAGTEVLLDQMVLQNDLDALSIVAEKTGGTVTFGPQSVEEAVQRITRDLGSYYTLAYRGQSDGSDRERRIEVRAKNRDYVVRARRTLVDRSDKTRAKDLVVARLFERGPAGDIDFDVKTLPGKRVGKGRIVIPIELHIPVDQLQFADEATERAANFTVLAVAGKDISQTTNVIEKRQRVTAQLGTQPTGHVTYTLDFFTDGKPTTAAITVFDDRTGLAGSQTVLLEGTAAQVVMTSDDPAADAEWKAVRARAVTEGKPLLVYFRPKRCSACTRFETSTLPHPTIQRRIANVAFATLPATAGETSKAWSSKEAGLALFDRTGALRVRWDGLPDTTAFGTMLDRVIDNAPFFETGSDVDAAIGLIRMNRTKEARETLERVIAGDDAEKRQQAMIARAMLDGNVKALEEVIATAVNPEIAGDAWFSIGVMRMQAGAPEEAARAFTAAAEVVSPESHTREAALSAVAQLRANAPAGPIRIVPLGVSVVSGRHTVKTNITSAAVASVSFSVDGNVVKRVDKPPFSTPVDFGGVPERHVIRVVGHDASGKELGSDEMTVNNAGETFAIRLVEPRQGEAAGPVRVATSLRVPPAHRVQRVVMTWNDRQRAVLTGAPWEAVIDVPRGEMGVLQVTAELDDGRRVEDAVLLNARGAVEHADVQLVELPITIAGGGFVTREQIVVREGGKRREVDSITPAAEAPLTVGLLIDSSASMHKAMPDVQEAAIRFLDAVLTERDRAFIITFDSKARLIQLPTSDKTTLRERIMSLRPEGLTALHDAIALGLLQFEGVKGRRALIVFSDGMDRTSRYKADDVEELARRSNVPLHLIAAVPDVRGAQTRLSEMNTIRGGAASVPMNSASPWWRSFNVLRRVAESTGGTAHMLANLGDLKDVYARIDAALRAQLLAFVRIDGGTRDGEWRSINVEIPGKKVHAPAGYYAPW